MESEKKRFFFFFGIIPYKLFSIINNIIDQEQILFTNISDKIKNQRNIVDFQLNDIKLEPLKPKKGLQIPEELGSIKLFQTILQDSPSTAQYS